MHISKAIYAMLSGKKVTRKTSDWVCYFDEDLLKFMAVNVSLKRPMKGLFELYQDWELVEELEYRFVIEIGGITKLTSDYYTSVEEIIESGSVICRADWTKRLVQ